jgi:hypothetical protein
MLSLYELDQLEKVGHANWKTRKSRTHKVKNPEKQDIRHDRILCAHYERAPLFPLSLFVYSYIFVFVYFYVSMSRCLFVRVYLSGFACIRIRDGTNGAMKETNYALFVLLLLMFVWTWKTLHPQQFKMPLVADSCRGQRIFMYQLPTEFNADILKRCKFGLAPWLNLCPRAANYGFGPPYNSSLGDGWFDTDTYMLEIIFHERMKQYRCLTPDPDMADAMFVPYYAGLDALRYLYPQPDRMPESSHGVGIMSWLRKRDEWNRSGGRNHFMVMGRTAWDFGAGKGWGTGLLEVPGVPNMTLLTTERRPWQSNEQAILLY